jgi:predicted metal-dependent peptidase
LWSAAGLIGAGRAKRSIGELIVAVDTSGSLPDKALQAILGEIGEIGREVQLDRIVIVPHDSRVYKPIEIEPGQPAPDRLPGGGGTLFAPVLRWIEENAPDAIGVVWITDGDASDWGAVKAPAVPVLWGHIPNYWVQPEKYPFGSVFEVPVGI